MRYKDAGVDFNAAHRVKSKISKLASQTFNSRVLREVGAFGGFYALNGMPRDAVLVASVDGVGTKLKIAFEMNRHASVGEDLVNTASTTSPPTAPHRSFFSTISPQAACARRWQRKLSAASREPAEQTAAP
jgi:hypothetical protein